MAEILGDLVVRIGGDSSDLQSAMQKAKNSVADFAGSARDAVPNIAAIGAAAAAAAAVGVAALISKTMEAVDAQAKLAARFETTSASIANLSHAASMSGVEFSKVESASNFLSQKLSQASEAGSGAAETFARLKLNASELQRLPLDERIALVNQALVDNVAASDRAAVAAEVFGAKAGSSMRLLSPAALAEAAAQVEKLGLNISDIDAAKIEQAGDAVEMASKVFDGMLQQLTAELAPVVTAIANQFFDTATSVEGFGTAGREAASGVIESISFVIDAAEGVRRTFEVAGKGLVIFALEGDKAMNELAQAIVAGPVDAINRVIDVINKISGQSIEPIDIGGLQANIDTADAALAEAYADMNATLMAPMPSGQFKAFVEEARTAAQEAAAVKVEMDKTLRGEGAGEDSGNPKNNEKAQKEDKKKADANTDLLERVNAVRASNATELEIVTQKEAEELATLQAAREQKLMTEQEYQSLKAETQKRFSEDRVAALTAANQSELEVMRGRQAEEMAQLQAARDQSLITDAEYQTIKAETEARFREERLGGIIAANQSELEIAQEKHLKELEQLQASLADKLLTEQEYEAMRLETLKRHSEEATAIKEREEEAKTRVQKEQEAARRAALGTALGDLSTLMNSGSRKMFEVGKAAAISQTVISTYEGAQKAYSSLAGIPVVGPALGVAAAGAAIAAGVARVQSIRSQQFGAGASTPTGSNTGQVNAGGQPVSASGGGGSAASGPTHYFHGFKRGYDYDGGAIIDAINEAQKNGGRIQAI